MLHIKSIISQALGNKEIDDDTICREAEKIIKKNTPSIEVFSFKNKTLYIKCFDSAIANEMFLNQEEIKDEINKFLKQDIIEKLIIKTN